MEKKEIEDVIFQVKINRSTFEFELFKKGLNEFEQSALEQYLIHYCKALEKIRIKQLEKEYLEDEE